MILLVLVPVESPGDFKKILLSIPQASLLPATIWLEERGQDAGMQVHSVLGYIKFFYID